MPDITELQLVTAWPALELEPVTTYLELLLPEVLRAGTIPLGGGDGHPLYF